MVGADALHAVMSRHIAARATRLVAGEERRFFYNPMWNHFGDHPPCPPGTYYYRGSNQVVFFWNMFDQVLIRPDLLEFFRDEDLSILDSAGGTQLLTAGGTPDTSIGSDHLPILFRLLL
jgi:hypothetical protein